MKKLNNKGLTAIEVLICFSITAVIVISLFKTINNYKTKGAIESDKNLITTYKNTVTKTIQEDIIKRGGVIKLEADESGNFVEISSGYIKLKMILNCETVECKDLYNKKIAELEIKYKANEADESEEYIKYKDTFNETEKFPLDISSVSFNEPKVDYDEDNGLLNIYVGVINNDLGDKYEILDLTLPLIEKWPNAYMQ